MNSAVMMLENTAKRFPDKTAIQDKWGTISFSELREQAISSATGLLKAQEYDRELMPVIVYLPKRIESVICFIASMYSGNPYVPVDSAVPAKRLQNILDNIGKGHIITNTQLAKNLSNLELSGFSVHIYDSLVETAADEKAVLEKVSEVIDSDPIYIIYTSGSTGVPKGVAISHRGIIDRMEWFCSKFGIDENTVVGNISQFYFDSSAPDIFSVFQAGAKMVIIPEGYSILPDSLPAFIHQNNINTLIWVPPVLVSLANSGILEHCEMPELKTVMFGGEAMPTRQLNIWKKYFPSVTYVNLYGPTEVTVLCTYYEVDRNFEDTESLPIGKACRNTRTFILNEDGAHVLPGETGELCFTGSSLALGYWNMPEITEQAFVRNPNCTGYEERIYRTGDLAYIAQDGNIMFVGRKDSQIKLSGYRIELGEIETAAKSLPEIGSACVMFDHDKQEIILFAECSAELDLHSLNLKLRKLIPAYMLPMRFEKMTKLPLTANGKIDRVLLKTNYQ